MVPFIYYGIVLSYIRHVLCWWDPDPRYFFFGLKRPQNRSNDDFIDCSFIKKLYAVRNYISGRQFNLIIWLSQFVRSTIFHRYIMHDFVYIRIFIHSIILRSSHIWIFWNSVIWILPAYIYNTVSFNILLNINSIARRSPDYYHTCYALSGLSVAQHNALGLPPSVLGKPNNLLVI
jgi:hypothetical protein